MLRYAFHFQCYFYSCSGCYYLDMARRRDRELQEHLFIFWLQLDFVYFDRCGKLGKTLGMVVGGAQRLLCSLFNDAVLQAGFFSTSISFRLDLTDGFPVYVVRADCSDREIYHMKQPNFDLQWSRNGGVAADASR